MPVSSQLNYLRIAPRKVRLVADIIRRKKAEEAQVILNFTTKKAASPLLKLLKQAIANAQKNFQLEPSNLFIAKITVDEGPKYKRWRARARGRAAEIQKKTSHVTLVLEEIKPSSKKKTKKTKEKQPSEEIIKTDEKEKEEKIVVEKPKFRPEKEIVKPKADQGLKRIFRRKAF